MEHERRTENCSPFVVGDPNGKTVAKGISKKLNWRITRAKPAVSGRTEELGPIGTDAK
jgi:hypothetical protein